MGEGFVYVLINPSMPGLVKIGLTQDASENRAAGLSSASGVPTDFIVVYDELVSDCREVERRLHQCFREYRVNSRREFFRIPIKTAVKALQWEAQGFSIATGEGRRVEILPELQRRYGDGIRPGTTGAAIVQLREVVLLEISRSPYSHLQDKIVEQVDLAIMTGGGGRPYFSLDDSIEVNVAKFLDIDDFSMINVTPLLTDKATHKISEAFHRGRESGW